MTAISQTIKTTEPTVASSMGTTSQLAASGGPSPTVGVSPDHNKYLHKKFKRIASTILEPIDSHSTYVAPSRQQPQQQHQQSLVEPTHRTAQPNGQHIDDGSRLKAGPSANLYTTFLNATRQDYVSELTPATNTFSAGMHFNEATEASATAKANTPQSSPVLHKINHHTNNNNYSTKHNHNNHSAPPQQQQQQVSMQPQMLSNGTPPSTSSSLIFVPTLIANKTNASQQEQPRQLFYINSSSPHSHDGQSVVLRTSLDPTIFADVHNQAQQQQLRYQQQIVHQKHQFQQMATVVEPTMSPSVVVQQQLQNQQQPQSQQPSASESPTPGRYVCPFCQLNCAKPSVLQKHIRAHTNERPYPCEPCGFAFKTRSNLYKHRR